MEGRLDQLIAAVGAGRIRRSMRGVPHILFQTSKVTYSAVWYEKSRTYRVFWPWNVYARQNRRTFRHVDLATAFMRARLAGQENHSAEERAMASSLYAGDPMGPVRREMARRAYALIEECGMGRLVIRAGSPRALFYEGDTCYAVMFMPAARRYRILWPFDEAGTFQFSRTMPDLAAAADFLMERAMGEPLELVTGDLPLDPAEA